MTSKEKTTPEYRITSARSKLITKTPFFAELLMAMDTVEDESKCPTLGTDGTNIYYNPAYVDSLSDKELTYVMVHETMHAALGHIWRRDSRDPSLFNIACDYIVNGYIDELVQGNKYAGNIMSRPNGLLSDNSYINMAVEEVYRDLLKKQPHISVFTTDEEASGDGGSDGDQGNNNSQGNDSSNNGGQNQQQNGDGDGQDDESKKDKNGSGNGSGQKQGKKNSKSGKQGQGKHMRKVFGTGSQRIVAPDNHNLWKQEEKKGHDHRQRMETQWKSRMTSAAQHLKNCGSVPSGLARYIGNLKRPQIDWRQALQEYIVEIAMDYGWTPPDSRIDPDEFGAFLPAFTETEMALEDILIFADSSGSMSEQDIITIISEVRGIIEQYKLNVTGKLYWFDAEVVDQPFALEDIAEDFQKLECMGGGGTSFEACARFTTKYQLTSETPPKVVLMLTDGYAPVPPESAWNGVPVIWVLTTPLDNSDIKDINYGRKIYVDPSSLEKE